jgi:hypothetical protein
VHFSFVNATSLFNSFVTATSICLKLSVLLFAIQKIYCLSYQNSYNLETNLLSFNYTLTSIGYKQLALIVLFRWLSVVLTFFYYCFIKTSNCTMNITTSYLRTVSFNIIYTPACFDIYTSSSGSITFVPYQIICVMLARTYSGLTYWPSGHRPVSPVFV